MQVNDDYFDELFARKLGNLEAAPPEDGWVRIENELNRRSRVARKIWLAAASFALVLSVTATVVYMQTNVNTGADQSIAVVVQENASQIAENQFAIADDSNVAAQPDAQRSIQPETQKENNRLAAQHSENSTSQGEAPARETAVLSPENVQIALQDDVVVQDVHEDTFPIHSSIPVYIDSWDKLLKAQPIKENWRTKIAQLKMETPEVKTENTVVIASTAIPKYDEFDYPGIANSFPKSQPRNHWEITGQFAPMYSYRAISSVPSGLQKSDFDEAESPLLAYSGGITISRRVLNRLSVQIGVFYSQMGQSINNVIPVANMYTAVSSNNPYPKNFVRTSSGSVTVASNLKSDVNNSYANYFNDESLAPNSVTAANITSPAKYRLVEQIDYLEIPLMLRYKVIDRKLNLYVSGGMSTNVLINNNVFIDNGNELVKGGAILMARPVNYSSTLGFGLGYQINRSLLVEFEPLFKYYLQPYTTSSQIGSHPYAFGVFTGVVYRF